MGRVNSDGIPLLWVATEGGGHFRTLLGAQLPKPAALREQEYQEIPTHDDIRWAESPEI